jgi:aryl-alcohol dehydrogenase-like predicted oxidoreductase
LEKRELGNSGLKVSPLSFGGNVFGWTIDKQQSFKILDAFVDAGFNLIDTADTYSWWVPGNKGVESETIIGEWFAQRKNRYKIILSTKVGSQNNEHPADISKKFILDSVEKSLRRLKTDHIDLYQSHFDDEKTPVEETLSAYQQLIKEGKVRVIGTSYMSPERIRESLKASEKEGLPKYQTLQPLYNLMEREDYENDLRDIVDENRMGVLSYSSLFLTGKYRSKDDLNKSQRGGGIEKYLNEKGFKVLKTLDDISEKHGTTQAAISLAWLMARPTITSPIVSATSLKQMESIIKAPQLTLDTEDVDLLNEVSL